MRELARMDALQAFGIGPRYRMYYRCRRCKIVWEDEWSCICNSRCPSCDVEHDPVEVEELMDIGEDDE